jgi:hypothetical protein
MVAMRPGAAPFCVGVFIWQEIMNCSENAQNFCGHSPYIMYIIRKVTKTKYPKDARYRLLQPKHSVTISVPSSPEELREQEGDAQWDDVAETLQPG